MTVTSGRDDRRRLLAVVAATYLAALGAGAGAGWLVRSESPLWVALVADLVATAAVFAASAALDNSSLYDPYWSAAPIPLVIYWIVATGEPTPRAMAALLLVAAWGTRLTYNCLARWRDLRHEDFRYLEIRAKTGKLYWPASFFSIHLLPTLWVFGGLLSAYAAVSGDLRWGMLDSVGVVLTGGAISIEALADRQLRRFLRARANPEDVLSSGLWGWSRHPNYLGEMLFWWGLFLLGLGARPLGSWPFMFLGPLAITCLFVFVSVPWMDRRLAARHPRQFAALKGVPALLPLPRSTARR